MRPDAVSTSTKGSNQNMPREPLRLIVISSLRCFACAAIAAATSLAPKATAVESRGI